MSRIDELLTIMQRLRDPDGGCPWDREQTFATIAPYTIEEAYEVADAIGRDAREELCDELGDLLFQIVFYAQMAREAGWFDFEDIVAAIVDKMIRRHPHVFGDARIASAEEQTAAWEQHKARERHAAADADAPKSHLDGITAALPALTRAFKLQRRAARVGFDWPNPGGVLDKIEEEIGELRAVTMENGGAAALTDEIGDLLFSITNYARHAGIDPETALRHANGKFERRFRAVERHFAARGRPLEQATLEEMDAVWDQVKVQEG